MNILMRPVYNRPEMLQLSLEYEIKARESYNFPSDLTTLFVIEHGTPKKTLELLKEYPFKANYIHRQKKFGLTVNILEGFKTAFGLTSDYVIYIEDDVLVHETYFQYLDIIMNMADDFSIISPYNFNDGGDVSEVYKGHHYAALAPLISKKFHTDYVLPCSNKVYYSKPAQYVINLGMKYKEHWGKLYKYKGTYTHWEQAGLHNRLVDMAAIEDDLWVYMPRVNRQQHIGYFGKNRPGGIIPGKTYEDRVENLRKIITSAEEMYRLTATKCYNDYKTFSPKLNDWDGTLHVK